MLREDLHLDIDYRNRYQLFYLSDGTIKDSRKTNWRWVEWEKVVQIDAFIHNKKYTVKICSPTHLGFMNFRWGGHTQTTHHDKVGNKIKGVHTSVKKLHVWTIGWTDGDHCFLKDIDFKTGLLEKEYKAPFSEFKNHLHPRLQKFKGLVYDK